MFNKLKNKNGFTLLELLVAMGIFSLVIGSVAMIMTNAFKSNKIIFDQLEGQSDVRKVLEQIVDAVRKANQSSIGSYTIESAGNYELRFYSNLDNASYVEKVRYYMDGTTFKRGIITPSGNPLVYATSSEQIVELAHNVKNFVSSTPIFLYYDQNYTGTSTALTQPVTPSDVRIIKIQLDVDKDPTRSPVSLHGESMVEIRNLKNN